MDGIPSRNHADLKERKRWGDTTFLLGGWSGPNKNGELSKWKPNLQAVTAAIRFAIPTARLTNIEENKSIDESHAEIPEPEEVSEEKKEEDTTQGLNGQFLTNTTLYFAIHVYQYTHASHCQLRRCIDY